MKVLLGGPESGKTTILLHYVYNEIANLIEAQNNEGSKEKAKTLPHACIITSKKKLVESKMIFGIYCEVSIETLREVKMKYIEDFDELVQFLTDFHLLPVKPSILAIDSLEHFLDTKKQNINLLTRQMRLNFLLTLLQDCQQYLDGSLYRHSSLMVSYKIGLDQASASLLAQSGKQAAKLQSGGEGIMTSVNEAFEKLDEGNQASMLATIKVDVQRTFQDLSRFSQQILYVARDKISVIIDKHLLTLPQRQILSEKYIDLFQLSMTMPQADDKAAGQLWFRAVSITSPGDAAAPDLKQNPATVEKDKLLRLKTQMFTPIVQAIREYQQQEDDD